MCETLYIIFESYIQETGRARRDGLSAVATLISKRRNLVKMSTILNLVIFVDVYILPTFAEQSSKVRQYMTVLGSVYFS